MDFWDLGSLDFRVLFLALKIAFGFGVSGSVTFHASDVSPAVYVFELSSLSGVLFHQEEDQFGLAWLLIFYLVLRRLGDCLGFLLFGRSEF